MNRPLVVIVVIALLGAGLLVPVTGASGEPIQLGRSSAAGLTEDVDNATDVDGVVEDSTDAVSEVTESTTESITDSNTETSTGSTTATVTESPSDTVTDPETAQTDVSDDGSLTGSTVDGTSAGGILDGVDDGTGTLGTANRTINGTVDSADDTLTGTVGSVDETVVGAAESVNDTLGGTVESVNGTQVGTIGPVNDTVAGLDRQQPSTETTSRADDIGPTIREAPEGTASFEDTDAASAPTLERAPLAPSNHGRIERRVPVPRDGAGRNDGPLPVGTGVGIGAVVIGALAHRGAIVADVRPDVFLRSGWSLRRMANEIAGWRSRLLRTLSVFRYSRYDDSDPLEHDGRLALYERILDAPGKSLSSVAEEADVPLSTARHHLRVLKREGLVDDRKIAGKRRFVPRGTDIDERVAALRDDAPASVLEALARRGPSIVSALAEELNRNPSTLTYHLKNLEEAGLVDRHNEGRTVVNHLTLAGRWLLDDGHSPDGDRPEPLD